MVDAVADLLTSKNIPFTKSGQDYKILCLNPEHDDSNPSLRINRHSGAAHCFACGWKANIFYYFDAKGYVLPSKVYSLKQKLSELQNVAEVRYPSGSYPYTGTYRNISTATYKKYEAFCCDEDTDLQDRIIFPIKDISGKISSFVGRHVLSNAEPRYIVSPRGKPTIPYPLTINKSFRYAVLVEGLFDMLRLVDNDVSNVVCCFGTDTLRKNAGIKLLPLKAQGVIKLYIMFDGDEPGQKAAKELKPILEELGYIVEILELPEDEDPGSLSKEAIEYLKRYIVENENSYN